MNQATAMMVATSETPEVSKRAALFIPNSASAADGLRTRSDLIQVARKLGLDVTAIYEVGQGKAGAQSTKSKLLVDAAADNFEVLVVPKLAALALGGDLNAALGLALDLLASGKTILSPSEHWLTQENAATRNLVVSILAFVVDDARQRRKQVAREGLERARSRNQKIGRPRKTVDLVRARALLDDGMPMSRAARALGVSRSHLRRALLAEECGSVPFFATAEPCPPSFPMANAGSPLAARVLQLGEASSPNT